MPEANAVLLQFLQPLQQQDCWTMKTKTSSSRAGRTKRVDAESWAEQVVLSRDPDCRGHAFLLHIDRGGAETRVSVEGQVLVCKVFDVSNALMNPSICTTDPRINLQQWDHDALRFERKFGEIVTKSLSAELLSYLS